MTRLVAVLGYSDASTAELHPVCGARLERAAVEARADDIVLFSGWARGTSSSPEADLMAACWSTPTRAQLIDREARTTLGNAIAVARAALTGSGVGLRVIPVEEPLPPKRCLREAAAWSVVPIFAVVAARVR